MGKKKKIIPKETIEYYLFDLMYGLCKTAKEIGCDYATLKRNMEEQGIFLTDEWRHETHSKACKESVTDDFRAKMSDIRKGTEFTDDHRANLSKSHKGKEPWNKGKKGVQTAWNKGKKGGTFISKTNEELEEIKLKKQRTWANKTSEELKSKADKEHQTKLKNGCYSKSNAEEEYYIQLVEEYGEVIREYKDPRYATPSGYEFKCDFYIPSEDLFIEYQGHWTHGEHPYNNEDAEDILLLEKWTEKAKSSKFYENAVEVWTIRDVEKIKVSKYNNLSIKFIYPNKQGVDIYGNNN